MKKRSIQLLAPLLFSSMISIAQWNNFTTVNTPVAISPKSQQNAHGVTDNKGGIIISWDDNRNSTTGSTDIYAQRMNKLGYAKWATNGIAVCTNSLTQRSVSIVEDGNGGAILTWEDNRNGNYDIYAQKVDSNGNVAWALDGIAVCNKTTTQKNPKIVGDGVGGAIIVWEDSVNIYNDIYAQHISASGTLLWATGGVGVCTAPNMQNNPRIDLDGSGGAIVTWQDKRGNVDYDIYAQRINASGATQWSSNGVVVCNATNTQNNPRVEPNGSGGAYICWVDKRNGFDYDIYAQLLDASGAAQWTSNGLAVSTATANQSAVDMKNFGPGVVLSWKDERNGSLDIYAQVISSTGVAATTANGIKLSNSLKSLNPNAIGDGQGNAILVWQDSTVAGWDVKSQKLNSSGAIQWTSGGITVCDASDDQINPSQVRDGQGGAIYIWEDHRNTADYDVYAQHIFSNGMTTVGIEAYEKAESNGAVCLPNPVSDLSTIRLKNPQSGKQYVIHIYDIYGKLIIESELNQDGLYTLSAQGFNTGMYHYIISERQAAVVSKGNFTVTR